MTAFRHKLIHNCTTQSKASRGVMAANGGNVPHRRAITTSHTACMFKMMCSTMLAAALQQLWIYDLFDDCWFAKHCTISVFKMSRPTDFQKLQKHFHILQFMKSLRVIHFLHLACQVGGAHPCPPPSVTPLSTMGVGKESIGKFLIGNRFQVKLRILSPYSNRVVQTQICCNFEMEW